jgi:hypothetical protein
MSIGTSKGDYYEDAFHMASQPYVAMDDNIREPPETKDKNEMSPRTLQGQKSGQEDPNVIIDDKGNAVDYSTPEQRQKLYEKNQPTVPDVEDRRDESFISKASSYLSQNFSADKLQFIMEHPNPLNGESYNHWLTEKNTLAQPKPYDTPLADELGTRNINFTVAKDTMKLNQQEQDLYQRHLTNLYGTGGVNNYDQNNPISPPSRSTLFVNTYDLNNKTYVLPSVYEGKILSPSEALVRAEQEGIERFPSYNTQEEANSRYMEMHKYMEKDTGDYFAGE